MFEDEDDEVNSPMKRADGAGHSGLGNDVELVDLSGRSNFLKLVGRLLTFSSVVSDEEDMESKLSPYVSEGEDPLGDPLGEEDDVVEDDGGKSPKFDEGDFGS